MSIFRRKQHAAKMPEPPKVETPPPEPAPAVQDGTGEEIAAVIAAICSMGGAAPSNLVVRSIVRVADQSTNWNRLTIDNEPGGLYR
ncbi:MAG: hypothetical protein FWE91_01525 [Defluviitaleaceae bacterium]|nr:hypothetical protein [Defluviitaleaceae bacterium]MCL2835719.1 hypothetical protein [Defluviitaleaceae bacterium]